MNVLVAGVGNIFRRDDGFGVEVARRLAPLQLPASVVDFGTRGFDLALALSNGVEAAIIVDAAARGKTPGTITVLSPTDISELPAIDPHGMDPLKALELAQRLGGVPRVLRIVACEPADLGTEEMPDSTLSEPVRAAVEAAIPLVRRLIDEMTHEMRAE
jgi:hydrogenase maturation protease